MPQPICWWCFVVCLGSFGVAAIIRSEILLCLRLFRCRNIIFDEDWQRARIGASWIIDCKRIVLLWSDFSAQKTLNPTNVTHFPGTVERRTASNKNTQTRHCAVWIYKAIEKISIYPLRRAVCCRYLCTGSAEWRPIQHYDENLHLCTPSHVVVSEMFCRVREFFSRVSIGFNSPHVLQPRHFRDAHQKYGYRFI